MLLEQVPLHFVTMAAVTEDYRHYYCKHKRGKILNSSMMLQMQANSNLVNLNYIILRVSDCFITV